MQKDQAIRNVVNRLDGIAEENRIAILLLLKKGEKCVCEIWKELDLPQNLVSHHLKVLKDNNFITSRKDGLKIFYSLEQENLEKLYRSLKKILNIKNK